METLTRASVAAIEPGARMRQLVVGPALAPENPDRTMSAKVSVERAAPAGTRMTQDCRPWPAVRWTVPVGKAPPK
jgi:hypothetical protein